MVLLFKLLDKSTTVGVFRMNSTSTITLYNYNTQHLLFEHNVKHLEYVHSYSFIVPGTHNGKWQLLTFNLLSGEARKLKLDMNGAGLNV